MLKPRPLINNVSIEFEIFGTVQGVYFRKYTLQEAKRLGIKGWCMNTKRGSVKGVLEGNVAKVKAMKSWLEKVGSPLSKIEKVFFTNEKDIKEYSYNNFFIKH